MSDRVSKPSSTVVIVGGGIAGMSAALRLAEHGVRVTVLETRKKLGGRATSFKDVRSGEVLDNCQHVVLGCCTNYLDFLGRLGSREKIRWTREQYWIESGSRMSVIRPSSLLPMPAPLHFSMSFLRTKFLSMGQVRAIGRACLKMLRMDRSREERRSFGSWLEEHGQTAEVVRRFWSPVVVSACNLDCDRVSAASAIHVFQEGFLANAHSADIGVAAVPLVELYESFERILEGAGGGGRVVLGAGVESLSAKSVTATDGVRYEADAVICAVPVERVNRLVGEEDRKRDSRFAGLEKFTHSPILGVHLRFDRNVMGELPHAVLVEKGVQWLFRKSKDGSSVHAVISAADEWVELDEEEIGRRVVADLRDCLRQAREAKLVSCRAVKEKLATFAAVPGLDEHRPSASGSSGIVLAGDYTQTGWPATMEGAARSGYAAAAAVLGLKTEKLIEPRLPVASLARFLGLRTGFDQSR